MCLGQEALYPRTIWQSSLETFFLGNITQNRCRNLMSRRLVTNIPTCFYLCSWHQSKPSSKNEKKTTKKNGADNKLIPEYYKILSVESKISVECLRVHIFLTLYLNSTWINLHSQLYHLTFYWLTSSRIKSHSPSEHSRTKSLGSSRNR